ncbi:hypothetical protein ACF1GW_24470 [Streptomyces achromogenes]|uniref:hypothetical protein n=1 Tax=Streptomyces achromogenes TaxID=67255 RepID=UPI0036FFC69E
MRLTAIGTGCPGAAHAARMPEPVARHTASGRLTFTDNARKAFPPPGCAGTAEDALRGADPVPRPTDRPRLRETDPEPAATLTARPRTVDGRGAPAADRRTAAGRRFRAPGRPVPAGEGQ